MPRSASVVISLALVALGIASSAGAQAPQVDDGLRAYSIIPPGQSGLPIDIHASDQLDMYAALIDDDDITENELDTYFHSAQFGPGAVIEREYSPRNDVTVMRDEFGIPHIYATTDAGAFYALGYTTAEDRLWHMDILRRAAKGTVSTVLGGVAVEYDKSIRRDFYSAAEYQKIFDTLDNKYGTTGAVLQEAWTEYAAGVNARMEEARNNPALRPPEYLVQGIPIEDWTVTDTLALVALQVRSFGSGGGLEFMHSAALQEIQDAMGAQAGKRAFEELAWLEDPGAYTTIPEAEGTFPSQDFAPADPKAVAMPDQPSAIAATLSKRQATIDRFATELGFRRPASNFLAVAPEESASGGALQFGAPQVGYTVPQFFMDIDVHSPSFDFRGPALPGASTAIPLGRGTDFAWSLTTGGSDLIDARIERLCEPDGSKPTKRSKHYRFKGKCKAMSVRTETIAVKGGTAAKVKVYRTVHGPVSLRTTAEGKPAALVFQRSFWKREHEFAVVLTDILSQPDPTIDSVLDALLEAPISFNAIYSGPDGIGYTHTGRFPIRADGIDPNLPSWGTGKWEWKGFLSAAEHPRLVDPAQGWFANWNNQPAVGWGQESAGWGPTHRVRLLSDRMHALIDGGGTATLSEVVQVIADAATVDGDAYFVGQDMVDTVASETGVNAAARDAVAAWIAEGSNRTDQDGDREQDAGTAVAVFDRWFDATIHNIFDDELAGAYAHMGLPISHRADSGGSAYASDFSNYLFNLLNDTGALELDYCDNIDTDATETCSQQVAAGLHAAVAELSAEQGSDPSAWTAPAEYLVFDEQGAVSVPEIPWQNRGTYNHAIEVLTP